MAGGAPIPVPITDPEEKILSIADLEKAGSQKMEKGARGESREYFRISEFQSCILYVFYFKI